MCSRFWAVTFALCLPTIAMAGEFSGQGRNLDGTEVRNVTVTAIRADNRVIFNRLFPDGNYTVPINDSALFQDDQSITLLFTSPGRDDARLDNLLGTGSILGLDVVLPLKTQAIDPIQPDVTPCPCPARVPCFRPFFFKHRYR